ncbi:MAG TPA: DUF2530 domain-containing protein [Microbacteriaceae bacterium]|jgi:Protein of unknown function (DUF2530).
MRLWLKDSERRPDPTPVATDDRKPMIVGLALWIIALIVVLIVLGPAGISADPTALWACVAGVGLGVLGLVYVHRQRR